MLKFEQSLTKYLVQVPKSKTFINDLHKEIFEEEDSKFIFSLIKNYFQKYKSLPSKTNLLSYFKKVCDKQGTAKETYSYFKDKLKKLFKPLPESDLTYLEENLFTLIKRVQVEKLINEIAPDVSEATAEHVEEWYYKFRKINDIQNTVDLFESSESLYITDYKVRRDKNLGVIPTYLNGLNNLTAVGGFYCPQMILILSSMKGFKTGFLLNLAVNFMIDGYKVYYADTENGEILTERRIHQTILECTALDIINKKHEKELKNILKQIKAGGGQIVYDYFLPKISTLEDVETKLSFHFDKTGFKPDIIIYDYLDKFGTDKKDSQGWEDINNNYELAIGLNSKLKCFSFTQSQLKQSALKKKVTEAGDIGGAISKIANCHAAFAINRTEEEEKLGIARLVSVAQREGKRPGNYFYIKIDYENSRLYELEDQNKKEKKK